MKSFNKSIEVSIVFESTGSIESIVSMDSIKRIEGTDVTN